MNEPGRWTRDETRLRSALEEMAAIEGREDSNHPGDLGADCRVLAVETETHDGMHTVVRMADHQGSAQLTVHEAAGVRSSVRTLLDLLGHERGLTRTEVALTPSGFRILDCLMKVSED